MFDWSTCAGVHLDAEPRTNLAALATLVALLRDVLNRRAAASDSAVSSVSPLSGGQNWGEVHAKPEQREFCKPKRAAANRAIRSRERVSGKRHTGVVRIAGRDTCGTDHPDDAANPGSCGQSVPAQNSERSRKARDFRAIAVLSWAWSQFFPRSFFCSHSAFAAAPPGAELVALRHQVTVLRRNSLNVGRNARISLAFGILSRDSPFRSRVSRARIAASAGAIFFIGLTEGRRHRSRSCYRLQYDASRRGLELSPLRASIEGNVRVAGARAHPDAPCPPTGFADEAPPPAKTTVVDRSGAGPKCRSPPSTER